jgi:Ran GTPase-activating protein (RanGAP) involved in mRNA processing and transport
LGSENEHTAQPRRPNNIQDLVLSLQSFKMSVQSTVNKRRKTAAGVASVPAFTVNVSFADGSSVTLDVTDDSLTAAQLCQALSTTTSRVVSALFDANDEQELDATCSARDLGLSMESALIAIEAAAEALVVSQALTTECSDAQFEELSSAKGATTKVLDLSDCNALSEEGVACIHSFPFVRELLLRNCNLGRASSTMGTVLASFVSITSLTSLDISNNGLSSRSTQRLFAALATNTHLLILNIAENALLKGGADSVAEALESNVCLTVLDVSKNQFGAAGMQRIAQALMKTTVLTELTISGWAGFEGPECLGSEGSGVTIEAGTTNADFSSKVLIIGSRGGMVLAAFMHRCHSLQVLNLAGTALEPEGAGSIADFVLTSGVISSLNMANCEIRSAGAAHVARIIEAPTALTVLDVTQNGLCEGDHWDIYGECFDEDSSGILAFCTALEMNTGLSTLEISRNQFPNDTVAALTKALTLNKALSQVNILHTGICYHDVVKLTAAVRSAAAGTGQIRSLCGLRGDEVELDFGVGQKTTYGGLTHKLGAGSAYLLALEVSCNPALSRLSVAGNSVGEIVCTDGWVHKPGSSESRGQVWGYFKNQSANGQTNAPEGCGALGMRILAGTLGPAIPLVPSALAGNLAVNDGDSFPKNLRSLDLSRNPCNAAESAIYLAATLHHATALRSLHVGCNLITKGPYMKLLMDVVESHGKIEVFCGVPIAQLKADSITEVDVSLQSLGSEGALVLQKYLQGNKLLSKLTFGDDIAVTMTTDMEAISFRGKKLGSGGGQICGDFMRRCPALTSVDVTGSGFGNEGLRSIASALEATQELTFLDASHNLGDAAIVDELLEAAQKQGKISMLCNVPICDLKANRTTELDVSGTSLGLEGALLLSKFLRSGSLTKLKFKGESNYLFSFSNEHHSTQHKERLAVTVDVAMTEAKFRNMDLGCAGACILAAFLPRCHALTELDISENGISSSGMLGSGSDSGGFVALAKHIQTNTTLTSLNLSKTQAYFSPCMQQMLSALETNRTMTSLDLSNNSWDKDAAPAIVSLIQNNSSLSTLKLANSYLGSYEKEDPETFAETTVETPEVPNVIIAALAKNTVLTKLDLTKCRLSNEQLAEIGQLLQPARDRLRAALLADLDETNEQLRELKAKRKQLRTRIEDIPAGAQ